MLSLLEQKKAMEAALNNMGDVNTQESDCLAAMIDKINASLEQSEIQTLRNRIEDMQLRVSQAIGYCRLHRKLNPALAGNIENLLLAIK